MADQWFDHSGKFGDWEPSPRGNSSSAGLWIALIAVGGVAILGALLVGVILAMRSAGPEMAAVAPPATSHAASPAPGAVPPAPSAGAAGGSTSSSSPPPPPTSEPPPSSAPATSVVKDEPAEPPRDDLAEKDAQTSDADDSAENGSRSSGTDNATDEEPDEEKPDGKDESLDAVVPDGSVLRYGWAPGAAYECRFTLIADIENERPTISGTVVYEPTREDPTSVGEEQPAQEGSGTAFVVTPNGVLVTCAHVVRGATQIRVHFGKKNYRAKVTAYDASCDLALLKIEAAELPCVPLARSETVELGQDVRVVGYPLTDMLGESVKISRGTIAGIIDRDEGKLFQIDANVNPGNSGGPLIDEKGNVVGIASALLAGESVDPVGFAVPADEALALLKQHNIAGLAGTQSEILPGPELARRVMPSVPLVKVRLGPGGVGSAEQRVVKFTGSCMTSSLVRRGGMLGSIPGLAKQDSGKLLVDSFGEIEAFEGEVRVPLLGDWLGSIGIETLPGDRRKQWKSVRSVAILRKEAEQSDPSRGMEFRPRFGGPPRHPFGSRPPLPFQNQQQQERIVVTPGLEETRYEIVSQSADNLVKIRKDYKLTALTDNKKERSPFEIKGTGTITWDKNLGLPKRSEFKATLVALEGDKNGVRIPFSVTWDFDRKVAGSVAVAPRTSPRTSPRSTPRSSRTPSAQDPEPEWNSPPPRRTTTASGPRQGAVDRAPSATGLDLFNPND